MSYASYNTKTQPKAKSQEPKPKAKSQSQKPNARSQSQKPKAKSKSEILAPNATKNVQIRDFGSKIQQVARKTAPDWTTKKHRKTKNIYALPLQLWCYSSGTKSDAVKVCCKSSGTKSDALKCGEKVAVPNRMLGNCVAEGAVPNRMLSSQKYSGLMQK